MPTYLTEQDVQDYGQDLINVTQRAALHAVSPALQDLKQANAELQQRLAQEQRHRLDQQIEHALPDFRERDRDPRWHQWLLGIDNLSGRVRQQLLNEATASGNPERVLAFFRTFQQEAGGTRAATAAAAASTRTRSAPSGAPTYTPAQIGELYARHRKGEFTGREAEWARIEYDFFRAQREGRVQGTPYLTK